MKKIKINKFLEKNKHLVKINEASGSLFFETTELSRAGLAFYSKLEYIEEGRVQLIGHREFELLNSLEENDIERFLASNIPLVIFSRDNRPSQLFLDIANKNNVLICISSLSTAKVFSQTYAFLEEMLAEDTQVHGVMLSIYGKGILIKGASGVGKSEVALELVKRGHILISDDMIIFKKLDANTLLGEAPDILKNKMEIRGIGIVDIQKLYGVTSVLLNSELDLIINLTNENEIVDRIGNDYLYESILGVSKKKINIPVLSGKNIANLVEVAVANFQLVEDYGYNASEQFIEELNNMLIKKGKK